METPSYTGCEVPVPDLMGKKTVPGFGAFGTPPQTFVLAFPLSHSQDWL